MTRLRWRLRPLLFVGSAGLMAVVLVLAERTAEFAVRRVANSPGPGFSDALGDLRAAFLVIGVIGLVLAIVYSALAGAHIAGQLRRLRTLATARSRGERAVMPRSDIAEVQAAANAVDLLATELERQYGTLAVERDELALLLSTVSEGILQVDPQARIVHANPAARAILGLRSPPRGQPVGALIRNLELRDLIARAAGGVDVPAHEITIDERRLLVAARPLRGNAHGNGHSGAVVAFSDLTELRRLEGVRRDFVANVSHELKTPLTSIRGYVETLLSDELPGDMQRQFLEVIQKNAERLHGIVDDLLDLSRLESGGWRPELRRLEAVDVVQETWNTLHDRSGRKHIEFVAIGDPVGVMADPAGLRQVLSNLFDNAVRHTPEGGRITARVSRVEGPSRNAPAPDTGVPSPPHGWVLFEIQDTGSGIPRDALPRIFERFYRVDPARSRAEGGTGLGLSIVRHLVDSMGGEVTAESELGKGTLIRVRLPAA